MSEQEKIQLFEDQKIRTAWDEDKEEWYFSVRKNRTVQNDCSRWENETD